MKRIELMKKRRVLKEYLISYISVALLVLVITGLAGNLVYSREVYKTEVNNDQEKLRTAGNALQKQINVLEKMALRISMDSKFLPAYFRRGVSYELEMMAKLKSYENYLPFDYEHYLYYPQMDAVYSGKAKYSLGQFFNYVYPTYQVDILRAMERDKLTCAADNEVAIIVFKNDIIRTPMQLLAIVPIKTLTHYVSSVSGIPEENMMLKLEGLSTAHEDEYNYRMDVGYGISILMMGNREWPLGKMISKIAPILMAVALICLMMAVYLSYRHYMPIHKLISYYVPEGQEYVDEFEVIDRRIAGIISENVESREKLQEITKLLEENQTALHKHLLVQLLYEGYDPSMREVLENVQIYLPGEYTALLLIDGIDRTEQCISFNEIERLGTIETAVFYVLPEKQKKTYVLVNALDRAGISFGIDLLQSHLHGSPRIYIVHICDSLENISQLGGFYCGEELGGEETVQNSSEDERIRDIINEIEGGNEKEAISYVQEIEMEMEIVSSTPQAIVEKRVELASGLWQMAAEHNQSVAKEQIANAILNTNTREEYMASVISAIRVLCHMSTADQKNRGEQRIEAIMKYIAEHLKEWELSLESVANEFRVSSRVVSADIKRKTGLNYIEYVKAERMKLACKLLLETEDSVMEIGNAVGYINISYFIRVFKEHTGMTPTIYRNTATALEQK